MEWGFRHQYLQMFGLELNKILIWVISTHFKLWVAVVQVGEGGLHFISYNFKGWSKIYKKIVV